MHPWKRTSKLISFPAPLQSAAEAGRVGVYSQPGRPAHSKNTNTQRVPPSMSTYSFLRPSTTVLASLAGLSVALVSAQGAEGAEELKPASPWKTSAALGFTLTAGNTETMMLTANIMSTRNWGKNELTLGADGTYGENSGDKNAEVIRGYSQYNWLFTDRFFGYARMEALHDAIADVEYRVTLSPGVGYYFIKTDTKTLRAEAGPAYILEKLGSNTEEYMTLRLAERFDWKLTKTSTLWQSAEVLPQVDRFENFLVNAEIGVETALTEKMTLRAFIQDTYDNEPAPGREENDVRFVTQVGYKF